MADLLVDLGRRLRAARTLSGKKVPELARELGWSADKIYRLETGKQEPHALDLAAFARATRQELEFFLGTTSDGAGHAVLTPAATDVNGASA